MLTLESFEASTILTDVRSDLEKHWEEALLPSPYCHYDSFNFVRVNRIHFSIVSCVSMSVASDPRDNEEKKKSVTMTMP